MHFPETQRRGHLIDCYKRPKGVAMLKVKDIMTKDVITVPPDMKITQAAKLLLEKKINGVPVMDAEGKLVGILCQSDLITQQKNFPIPSLFTLLDGFIPLRSMSQVQKEIQKITANTVLQAMTPNPKTIHPEMKIEDAASIMVEKKFHTLPVMDGTKLVGILGKEDLLKTLMSGSEGK
jgi:CBS domain-containing protein